MMNEFESGLVHNFEKLGYKGLVEKLSGIFSSTHMQDSELFSVLIVYLDTKSSCNE